MNYKIIPPCEELKEYISYFWVATWDEKLQKSNAIYYVIANSLAEITFAFQNNSRYAELLFSSVQGQTAVPTQFPVSDFYHLIGVSFYPHAIPKLFNIPANKLYREFMSLDTFLGQEGSILTEKMALAPSSEQRIAILSDFFKSLLPNRKYEDPQITRIIRYIKENKGTSKVIELAREVCLSPRQFKRRFAEFSGFNPKMYSRIIRFESVIKSYSQGPNLTELAYANGYFDQAHLNHEFKAFTGFNPKHFWKLSE
ncbi:AraC family transcriptional regulator [Flexithrix dorotheae]|uniref:AraC family transcriptional regulator n=1 Tax=Flexithrix dorotheae TaxID=70993 RepID=UPI00037DD15B|nr:AraC family transcriptional regulator [Flexithrix dorotheae]